MKPESNQFSDLRKLLAAKRYEEPPPGYFEDFASTVIARIYATPVPPQRTKWEMLRSCFELKPMWVGAYSVAVCGLLLCSLSLSQMIGLDSASAPVESFQLILPPILSQAAVSHWSDNSVEPDSSSVSPVMPEGFRGFPFQAMSQKASLSWR